MRAYTFDDNLKSNMDRFIVTAMASTQPLKGYLKSNMDRFIELKVVDEVKLSKI